MSLLYHWWDNVSSLEGNLLDPTEGEYKQYMCFFPSWICPSGEPVSRFRTLQSLLQPRLWFSGQRVVLEILAEGESAVGNGVLLRIILLELKHI